MNIEVINQLNQDIKNSKLVALVTITESSGSAPGRQGNMMLVYPDGTITGTCGGGKVEHLIIQQALGCIENGVGENFDITLEDIGMSCGGRMKGYVDIHKNEKQLVIIGGGHIGARLYSFGLELGFNMTIIDDREEFANSERFPKARTEFGELNEILANEIVTNKFVVIVSRGHDTDYEALRSVIERDYAYLGLIGSKKKVIGLLERLTKDGIDYNKYEDFYAPVGLAIARKDPAEIALSIMAEILLMKNKGSLEHMRYQK